MGSVGSLDGVDAAFGDLYDKLDEVGCVVFSLGEHPEESESER